MLFNSSTFILFLFVVFVVYYSLPKLGFGQTYQVALLFLSSLVFYGFEMPILLLLLLFSLGMNCIVSRGIVLSSKKYGHGKHWIWWGVGINLAILLFFKYAFLLVNGILPDDSLSNFKNSLMTIPLPVGISFYTFQAISLLVDLNKQGVTGVSSLENDYKNGSVKNGFLNIAFYISFFPQLVAGPIVKAHTFFNQISTKLISEINWNTVTKSLVTGYFLKMVIADNLKDVTYLLSDGNLELLGKVDLLFLLYGYSFQIFADFAGYSLIAIGLGAMFGYKFPENFNFPYISSSITEFWRRWHISLSSFLKEYLYFPLGGNRKGAIRTYINLFLVMLLGGLWHGAAWSYAIWGITHGVLLALEKIVDDIRIKKPIEKKSRFLHIISILITFHIISILWLLFLMPDFTRVVSYFSVLFTTDTMITKLQTIYIVTVYSMPIVIYHLIAYIKENPIQLINNGYFQMNSKALALSAMLFFIILNSGTPGEFIYFQF